MAARTVGAQKRKEPESENECITKAENSVTILKSLRVEMVTLRNECKELKAENLLLRAELSRLIRHCDSLVTQVDALCELA